ncbi:PilT/PilU family type 4a pilus ATPase (plasmid) [Pontibacillus sp. ALD_SL1]|uniref:type IV pilus twitching motility protein PilT n=1 Tax=Pontibacillus sp. ALD_SL1 TaxID=2777185 RepID=UPI001A96B3CD|nr:PilT/PilU family type 4a pilus ATPase [Pontibacillus sp. ALD_SL1]QST02362.1 PilT/PilU family type 4a pilus ATPase [Pontibacillus sp. ALD_SL1]
MKEIDVLIEEMMALGASDMHLNHMAKVSYRIDGEMEQVGSRLGDIITGESIFEVMLPALTKGQQTTYLQTGTVDFAYELNGVRFRGSMISSMDQPSCTMRIIPSKIIPIEELKLPKAVIDLFESPWGLLLVTGPTGSGKTTTLASGIDYINRNRKVKIYTAEHPVEYVHQNKKSIITQREVPSDVGTFARSMVDAMRNDPDVILVGEMRDHDTIGAAMTSAETGHLVMSTLHTNTAPQTIYRILHEYPSSEHERIREQLAQSLRGVVSQRLFKNPKGGRTATLEVMIVDDDIRELIRKNEIEKIYDVMRKKRDKGNILMTDSINMAKQRGTIQQNVKW